MFKNNITETNHNPSRRYWIIVLVNYAETIDTDWAENECSGNSAVFKSAVKIKILWYFLKSHLRPIWNCYRQEHRAMWALSEYFHYPKKMFYEKNKNKTTRRKAIQPSSLPPLCNNTSKVGNHILRTVSETTAYISSSVLNLITYTCYIQVFCDADILHLLYCLLLSLHHTIQYLQEHFSAKTSLRQ